MSHSYINQHRRVAMETEREATPRNPATAPGMISTTATVNPIKFRASIPRYSGPREGIALEDWFLALEGFCQSTGKTSDDALIAEARDSIDYSKGDARKIIKRKAFFASWETFKTYFRAWALDKPPQRKIDHWRLYSARWKSSQTFLEYIDELRDIIDRLVGLGYNKPEDIYSYTRFLETAVCTQLPEKVRENYIDLDYRVTSYEEFEDLATELQLAMVRAQEAKPGSAILAIHTENRKPEAPAGHQNRRIQKPGETKTGETRTSPSPWEKDHKLCGRCLKPGHFRAQCRGAPRCSFCKSPQHEFLECQIRPQKGRNNSYGSRYPRVQEPFLERGPGRLDRQGSNYHRQDAPPHPAPHPRTSYPPRSY